uniref:Oxysterol-binding protein n=1 Tax=Panagrolaimus superbus TaxID=310955 RepID=A0A914XWP8_9BILA
MPPILTENSFNDYSTEEDEDSQTWPKYLLAAIGTVIGLIILGVLIWFLIKYLKKRKQKVFEEDEKEEESKLSSIIIDPSNSTVIESENQKSVESCSVISADNNSKSENEEATKSIENLKEIPTKIPTSTIQRPQHPEETKKSLSKQKVEIPTTNSIDQKLTKVCEMPKKNAETPKKTTTAVNVPIIAKKTIVSEEEQEASSKMDGENNASKDLSKEAIVVKKVIVADGGGGEKVNKEIKNVETPKKPKEKIKEDETVKVTENVSVEEEDLKKKKKEEKREKLKKQFTEKAEKKKQKKQKNNKLKQFDSKESWSDPPNSADIYIKTVKPEMPAFVSRTELPSPAATKGASIWSVLRHSVGKDLSRVTVPIHFNEPLSYLQRLAEYMEYISLIKEASTTDDPIKRLELISAFALSNVSSNNVRLSKPFNPLLYETYELSKPQFGFKFIAEQVSHHPPISAFYSQGDEFEFYGNVEPKIKFWGRSLEDNPEAFFTLILKSYNETYTWKAASFSLHNLIMGKMLADGPKSVA